MKTPIDYLLRAPGASLRLAGGLGLLSLAALPISASAASPFLGDISLNIVVDAPPPPPRTEVIVGVSPGPDYVWIGGYWDGAPGHYTWVGGRWDHPPHGHGQWFAPHWDKGHDGHYHQTKGEWRDPDPRH
jgi:WXXGXW repeat (2 copies)